VNWKQLEAIAENDVELLKKDFDTTRDRSQVLPLTLANPVDNAQCEKQKDRNCRDRGLPS
jgi:hypothetical protein